MKNLLLVYTVTLALCITGCPTSKKPVGTNGHNQVDRSDSFLKQKLLDEHNVQRQDHHEKELLYDRDLAGAAQKWAEHMSSKNRLYHGDLRSKVNMQQWSTIGENIAWGQQSVEEVIKSWMNSRGHRRNILNKDFYHVGFGIAHDRNGRIYWCAIFGGLKTEPD